VAVPPSPVHCVLHQAGRSSRWTPAPGGAGKRGFDQPQRSTNGRTPISLTSTSWARSAPLLASWMVLRGDHSLIEFKACLRERDLSRSRAQVHHPQSNGKVEGFHRSLKTERVRTTALGGLSEAQRLIATYVNHSNSQQLTSALQYLTPDDYLRGPERIRQRLAYCGSALQAAAQR